jgi:hypothetical protein
LIFITVDIFKHTAKKKKIKRADQILPEVYGATLSQVVDEYWCIWYELYCEGKLKIKVT